MPVKNGAATIRRAISSIRSQDYTRYELLVCDGGSTDGTLELLRELNIMPVSYTDKGADHAPLMGYAAAQGDIVTIIGCDDEFLPGAFAHAASLLNTTMPQWLYGPLDLVKEDGTVSLTMGSRPVSFEDMKNGMQIGGIGSFLTRPLIEECGYVNPGYKCASDYELYMRFFKRGFVPLFTEQRLARYYLHGNNMGISPQAVETAERIKREYANA